MRRSGIGIRPDPCAAHLGLASPDYSRAIKISLLQLRKTGNSKLSAIAR